MGLFDHFNRKKKSAEVPEASGWDAIEQEFLRVYPGQTSPKHYAAILPWRLGGKDPLDGISVYDGGPFWHFVSFGLSELYDKETDDPAWSGYGYELTLKLAKNGLEDEEAEIRNICGILQMIARLIFTKGELFRPFEYLYTGQTEGIDAYRKSALTGFITIPDPSVRTLSTANGTVEFVELIGMTDSELKTLSDLASVEALYRRLGSDQTDYTRRSLL